MSTATFTPAGVKKSDDITYAIETITPDQARAYLERNVDNRPLRRSSVEAITRDIDNENWVFTGDPIRFDVDGNLQDGQHRLTACAESGHSITTVVMRGLPVKVRDYIDSGIARTAGDAVAFSGRQHSHALAAVARVAIGRSRGLLQNTLTGVAVPKLTHAEILTWVEANGDAAVEAIKLVSKTSIRGMRDASASYAAMRFLELDPILAHEFFDSIHNHVTKGKGDPRYAVIEHFAKAKADRRTINLAETLFILNKAWNAIRTEQNITFFRVVSPTSTPDKKVGVQIPEAI